MESQLSHDTEQHVDKLATTVEESVINKLAELHDDSDGEETLATEVIRLLRDDVSSVPQVKIMDDEIEELHFEDTYQMHRLNKEPDINNISMQQLMLLLDSTAENFIPVISATIRAMKQQTLDIKIQMDSGANRSVTPFKRLLHNIQRIQPISIDGVGGTITMNEVGCIRQVQETIISPNDITLSQQNDFEAWGKYCNVKTGCGQLAFFISAGIGKASIPTCMRNGLWYSKQKVDDINYNPTTIPALRHMSARAEYELWHQRLAHAGEKFMSSIYQRVDEIPNLHKHKHNFHRCECCMRGKVKSAPKKKTTSIQTTARGQMFHMDFGFVRGSEYKTTNEKGKIVTSMDG